MMNKKKDLILDCIDKTFEDLPDSVHRTVLQTNHIVIDEMSIDEVQEYVKENNIKGAYFGTIMEGEGGFLDTDSSPALFWDIHRPITDEEFDEKIDREFRSLAFRNVSETMYKNGYERVGVTRTGVFKEFSDTTPLKMYMDQDLDRLYEYYSISFKEVVKK